MFDYFKAQNVSKCIKYGGEVSCVADPVLTAVKEILLYELKQLSYYLLKLEDFGIVNQEYKFDVIQGLCVLSFNMEVNRSEFKEYLKSIINKRCDSERKYISYCEKNNQDCQILKSYINECKDFDFLEAIKQGEKQSINKNTNLDTERKNLYELFLFLLQNTSLTLNELRSYNIDLPDIQLEIIKILSSFNFTSTSIEKIKSRIEKFSQFSLKAENKLTEAKKEKFGKIRLNEVYFRYKKGHAILVTGNSLIDLYNFLEYTKDIPDLYVYTHDTLILAHSYDEFKKFPHLIGHYQKSLDNLEMDFSTFPGSILVTRNPQGNYLNIIRGLIYTTNTIAGVGMQKIIDNDFSPILKTLDQNSGFKRDITIDKIQIGYDFDVINKQLDELIEQINNDKIKYIIVIGLLNKIGPYDIYFDKFLNEITDEVHIISLSFKFSAKNITHITSYYDYSLIYKIIDKLLSSCKNKNIPINIIITEYNLQTITHLFNLKYNYDIKDIYLSENISSSINPSMENTLKRILDLKQLGSTPEKDIADIIGKENDS